MTKLDASSKAPTAESPASSLQQSRSRFPSRRINRPQSSRFASAVAVGLMILGVGCHSGPNAASTADAIYVDADVITLNDIQPHAEALAVKDGKILAVGSRRELENNYQGKKTVIIELDGKTLTSSFIDPYSHFSDSLSVNRINTPNPTPEQILETSKAGQMTYAKAGITTVQDSGTRESQLEALQALADKHLLVMDVVSYPSILDLDKVLARHPSASFGAYRNRLKLGGCEITLDGSPQDRTAFFTTPYLTGGPTGQRDWLGEPALPQDVANASLKKCYDMGLQALIHASGDGAVDMALKAHEFAASGNLYKDRRTVMIQTQFARKDQLRRYAEYKLIPSFFTEDTILFADENVKNHGREQAYFMSPLRTAVDLRLRPTNHTGYPAAPIDQMATIWTAVNRSSADGEVIGPDQRISPIEALKAITINAAYQYGEQNSKGSLEPGKLADLVVLSQNPLTVDPMTIKDIKVVETIKEGKTIYKAQ